MYKKRERRKSSSILIRYIERNYKMKHIYTPDTLLFDDTVFFSLHFHVLNKRIKCNKLSSNFFILTYVMAMKICVAACRYATLCYDLIMLFFWDIFSVQHYVSFCFIFRWWNAIELVRWHFKVQNSTIWANYLLKNLHHQMKKVFLFHFLRTKIFCFIYVWNRQSF